MRPVRTLATTFVLCLSWACSEDAEPGAPASSASPSDATTPVPPGSSGAPVPATRPSPAPTETPAPMLSTTESGVAGVPGVPQGSAGTGVPDVPGGAGTTAIGGASGTGGTAVAGTTATGGAAAGSGGRPSAGGGGAGGESAAAGSGSNLAPYAGPFMLGADISSVQQAIDEGATYVDTDGQTKSIFALLAAHGFNAIRLRTFVDPGAEYGYSSCAGGEPYCDTAHNVEFGRQVKEAGMTLLLDFHYSDTWADPGKQVIPAAWREVTSVTELAGRVRAYTEDAVQQMVDGGARPDVVQVGNEITPGMLIHVPTPDTDCYGNNSQVNPLGITGQASDANWDNLAELLRAGVAGVKAVDPTISILLHVENTESAQGVRSWVENARSRGVEFDLLGLSCYTEYQGEPAVWRNTFETLAETNPDLQFVIAEYNPERTEANRIMRDLPDGRGVGTFFWEPTQSGAWGQSMFTRQGNSYRANASDFAEYDALRDELGL